MASAILTITACDNASKRAVKSVLGVEAQKQNTIENLKECSDKIIELIEERRKTTKEITTLLEDSDRLELTKEQKARLNELIKELKPKTDIVAVEISRILVDNKASIGCFKLSATQATRKNIYLIDNLRIEELKLAKQVAQITKMTNIIIEAAAKDESLKEQTTLIEQQNYLIKAELADALTESNKDGNMYILRGKVHIGNDAQDELNQYLTQKKTSVCYLEATTGKLPADSKLSVTSIRSVIANDQKTSTAHIVLAGESSQLYVFKCNLNSSEEVPSQVRSVFSELIELNAK